MVIGTGSTLEGGLGLEKASVKNSLASDQVLLPGLTPPPGDAEWANRAPESFMCWC